MIPVKDALTQFDNLPGEEISFGIGDPRWVMKTQAALYSDITTAIIREYSTNAYDANVMAGNPDPINVTLPSVMDPFFTVEDKGVGMNVDLFRKVYTQFGISDKRDSNSTNGMLGYGSKSGVAYTTSFQVITVRDGIKVHGVVMRKPDWEIVLKVVATNATTEPNGTKIVIPVHNVTEFVHKANTFYKYWLPGRVLVNGAEPTHHVGEKIVDGFYYSDDYDESRVVMGNVAYRINNPRVLFRDQNINAINFVAYVDNGAVEFTPSREDLAYTDATKATLQKIVDEFSAEIKAKAQAEVNQAVDHAHAFKAYTSWSQRLGDALFAGLTYKGDSFENNFTITGDRYAIHAYRGATMRSVGIWQVTNSAKTLYVTEFDKNNVSSEHKRMSKEYAKQKGYDIEYVIFTPMAESGVECKWITREQFITFAEMKAACPKPRKPSAGSANPNTGRIAGSWDYINSVKLHTQQTIPDVKNQKLFWISLQTNKAFPTMAVLRFLGETNAAVIIVPTNRHAKFARENPTVLPFVEWVKAKVVMDAETLLSDESKLAMNLDSGVTDWLTSVDLSKIDDPGIHKAYQIMSAGADTDAYERNNTLARYTGQWYTMKHYRPHRDYNPFEGYKLMIDYMDVDVANSDEFYLYLNAVYAARKKRDNV